MGIRSAGFTCKRHAAYVRCERRLQAKPKLQIPTCFRSKPARNICVVVPYLHRSSRNPKSVPTCLRAKTRWRASSLQLTYSANDTCKLNPNSRSPPAYDRRPPDTRCVSVAIVQILAKPNFFPHLPTRQHSLARNQHASFIRCD